MAKKTQRTSETLDEIQSAADKLGEWIREHVILVSSALGGLLVLAAVGSYVLSLEGTREGAASLALADARANYLQAMGAAPGSLVVPELANPEAAESIRAEYLERFEAIADAHTGTVSGALARLEVAQLVQQGGGPAELLEIFEQILAEGPRSDRLRGLILQRLAQSMEDAERWEDAAQRHEQAADLSDYPLRHWAMADAARCRAVAGDREAALALYRRLDSEAPDLRLPDHQRVRKRELEAASTL